jgi:hypothetical protein
MIVELNTRTARGIENFYTRLPVHIAERWRDSGIRHLDVREHMDGIVVTPLTDEQVATARREARAAAARQRYQTRRYA